MTAAPGPERARRLLLGVLAGGALLVGAAAWIVATAGDGDGATGAGHGHHQRAGPATVLRPVGPPRTAALRGGELVRLEVAAEVPAGGPRRLTEAPAGAPLRLTFTAPRDGDARPRLRAERLNPAARPTPIRLERDDLVLLNRRTGDIVVPAGGAGGGHAHDAPQPGEGLAQLSPGGGLLWATKVARGAGAVQADAQRRRLFVAVPARGGVEVVDMLRHRREGGVTVGGTPGALRPSPDGRRLWVADGAGGPVTVVDAASRRILGRVRAGDGRQAVALDAKGERALVVSAGGRAALLDAGRLAPVARARLGGRVVGADYAARAQAFVVAHADGRLSVVPLAAGDRLGGVRTLTVGGRGAGTTAVAVAPDGRTAVVLNTAADAIALADVAGRAAPRTVAAGRAPSEVVFVGGFAIVRNRRSAEVTWVDLRTPSRSNDLVVGTAPGQGLFVDAAAGEALVPSRADRRVFRLHVMHGRPIVTGEVPNPFGADAGVVSDGGLERTAAGVHEIRTVIDAPGRVRLRLRLPGAGEARFTLPVAGAASRVRTRARDPRLRARPGEPVTVRFDVTGARPAGAQVLAYAGAAGAIRQARAAARRVGPTAWEATLRLPDPGLYRLTLIAERGLPTTSRDLGAVVTVAPRKEK